MAISLYRLVHLCIYYLILLFQYKLYKKKKIHVDKYKMSLYMLHKLRRYTYMVL